ncbi:hypothetical protein EIK56_09770 [Sphingomonas sp. C8-2]|nr:hypothetical protein EIK56_09770 [Sphingomonas sp. C8-2]
MSRKFAGKTAFVTGGETGIGRVAALRWRQKEAVGGFARYVLCDVAEEDAVAAAVREAAVSNSPSTMRASTRRGDRR